MSTKNRNLSFRERAGSASVTVYVTRYNPDKKRGEQVVLGSFDKYSLERQGVQALEGTRLEESLGPEELRQVEAWRDKRLDEVAARQRRLALQRLPAHLRNAAAALDNGDSDPAELDGDDVHAALDELRRKLRRAGVRRTPRQE